MSEKIYTVALAHLRLFNHLIDLFFIFIFQILTIFFVALIGALFSYDVENWSVWIYYGAAVTVTFYYYFFLELTTGKTLGKILTGTQVASASTKKLGAKTIAIRTLARCIPLESLTFLFGERPVGLHDRLSGTKVVKLEEPAVKEVAQASIYEPEAVEKASKGRSKLFIGILFFSVFIYIISLFPEAYSGSPEWVNRYWIFEAVVNLGLLAAIFMHKKLAVYVFIAFGVVAIPMNLYDISQSSATESIVLDVTFLAIAMTAYWLVWFFALKKEWPRFSKQIKKPTYVIAMGGYYAYQDSKGLYHAYRLIDLEQQGYHCAVYDQEFSEKPTLQQIKALKPLIGHAPLQAGSWELCKNLELLGQESLTNNDLDGYKAYLKEMGNTPESIATYTKGLIAMSKSRETAVVEISQGEDGVQYFVPLQSKSA